MKIPAEFGDNPASMDGFDPSTRTLPCHNCGNPYLGTAPTGTVPLRPDGTPCTHEYRAVYSDHQGESSMYLYECLWCPVSYRLDYVD